VGRDCKLQRRDTAKKPIKGPWDNPNASWYVTNDTLHRDLKVPTIKETIKELCQRYRDRLEVRPNNLVADLMKAGGIVKRLESKRPTEANIPQLNTFEQCTRKVANMLMHYIRIWHWLCTFPDIIIWTNISPNVLFNKYWNIKKKRLSKSWYA